MIRKSLFLSLLFSMFITVGTANAISLSPTKINETAVPGQEFTGQIILGNTEATPKVLKVDIKDYYLNEAKGKVYSDTPMPRGMSTWVTLDTSALDAEPGESVVFNYTIKIPEDVKPGGYTTGIIAYAEEKEITSSGVGVQSRAAAFININIEGEYKEELVLQDFGVDKSQFLKGNLVFFASIKNLGDANEAPAGTITVYNEKGEQIKGIYAITREAYGQKIIAERKDALPVNPGLGLLVYPEETKIINIPWGNREVDAGKYTAKINLYYGKDNNKKLEDDFEFEIIDNFGISELKANKSFNWHLPVSFTGKIQNTGTTPIEPKGRFVVKNIFGAEKYSVDFTSDELSILSGQEKDLTNMEWHSGFAFGYYNAVLSIDALGKTYAKSVGFWVLSWWQIIVTTLVVVVLIFVITKLIKTYSNLKAKLKNLEKK